MGESAPAVETGPPAAVVANKGSMQTVLELTFPDLYKSVLLPVDLTKTNEDQAADAPVEGDAAPAPVVAKALPVVEPQYQQKIDQFRQSMGTSQDERRTNESRRFFLARVPIQSTGCLTKCTCSSPWCLFCCCVCIPPGVGVFVP